MKKSAQNGYDLIRRTVESLQQQAAEHEGHPGAAAQASPLSESPRAFPVHLGRNLNLSTAPCQSAGDPFRRCVSPPTWQTAAPRSRVHVQKVLEDPGGHSAAPLPLRGAKVLPQGPPQGSLPQAGGPAASSVSLAPGGQPALDPPAAAVLNALLNGAMLRIGLTTAATKGRWSLQGALWRKCSRMEPDEQLLASLASEVEQCGLTAMELARDSVTIEVVHMDQYLNRVEEKASAPQGMGVQPAVGPARAVASDEPSAPGPAEGSEGMQLCKRVWFFPPEKPGMVGFLRQLQAVRQQTITANAFVVDALQQVKFYMSEVRGKDMLGLNSLLPGGPQCTGAGSTPMTLSAFTTEQLQMIHLQASDLGKRICPQLGLLVADAAELCLQAAGQGHGLQLAQLPPALDSPDEAHKQQQQQQQQQQQLGGQVPFSRSIFEHFAQLVNQMLTEAVNGLIYDSLHCCASRFLCWAADAFSPALPPMFHVQLDAVGQAVVFNPPLEDFDAAILENLHQFLDSLSHTTGLVLTTRLIPCAVGLSFDVEEGPALAAILKVDSRHVRSCLQQIQAVMDDSRAACTTLLQQFSGYSSLLIDPAQIMQHECKALAGHSLEEYSAVVEKYRTLQERVLQALPASKQQGMYLVDATALIADMSNTAKGVADALLINLQDQTGLLATNTRKHWQGLVDAVQASCSDLHQFYKVKAALAAADSNMAHAQDQLQDIQHHQALFEHHHHLVPDGEMSMWYEVLHLPLFYIQAVRERRLTVPFEEDALVKDLQADQHILEKHLAGLHALVQAWEQESNEEAARQHVETIAGLLGELAAVQRTADRINGLEQLLRWNVTDFAPVQQLARRMEMHAAMWSAIDRINTMYDGGMYGDLQHFDVKAAESSLPQLQHQLGAFRQMHGPALAVVEACCKKAQELTTLMPLVAALRMPGMRQRHWSLITSVARMDISRDCMNLHGLLAQGIHQHMDVIAEVAADAAQELVVENAVDHAATQLNSLLFDLGWLAETDSPMLRNSQALLAAVDAATITLRLHSSSPHAEPHRENLLRWLDLAAALSSMIKQLMGAQEMWMLLKQLFLCPSHYSSMPSQAHAFSAADHLWSDLMKELRDCQRAVELAQKRDMTKEFAAAGAQLQAVHLSTLHHLSTCQTASPRCAFLDPFVYLQFLARGHNPAALEAYLPMMFSGIRKLQLDADKQSIIGICDASGEVLPLLGPSKLQGRTKLPEDVVAKLEGSMHNALKQSIKKTVQLYSDPSPSPGAWCSHPCQVALMCASLWWSGQVEACLDGQGKQQARLEALQSHVASSVTVLHAELRQKLHPTAQRRKLQNLLLLQVYHRDIIQQLLAEKVQDRTSWQWQALLRYQWCAGRLTVVCGGHQLPYGYEYHGSTQPAPIHPATDRCLAAAAASVATTHGAILTGQQGGDAHTVVEHLACFAGSWHVLVDCLAVQDLHALQRCVAAMAVSGAWLTLGSYNRVAVEIVSALSHQLQTIQSALASGVDTIQLQGPTIQLSKSCAVFLVAEAASQFPCCHPALPAVRASHRQVQCLAPDIRWLVEMLLCAAGFTCPKLLAARLETVLEAMPLYALDAPRSSRAAAARATASMAAHLLQHQSHQDLSSNLSDASAASRLAMAAQGYGVGVDYLPALHDEACLLLQAADSVVGAWVRPRDREAFRRLAHQAMLGQVACDAAEVATTSETVLQELQDSSMTNSQFRAAVQLDTALQVGRAAILVGPAAAGKTHIWKELHAAWQCAGVGHATYSHIFPGALRTEELLGWSSNALWHDGVIARAVRAAEADPDRLALLVVDGAVSRDAAEVLLPALDRRRQLQLASVEMLPVPPGLKFVLEVDALAGLAPDLLLRCSIVHVEEDPALWEFVFTKLAAGLPAPLQQHHDLLHESVRALLPASIQYCQDALNASRSQHLSPLAVVHNTTTILEALLAQVQVSASDPASKGHGIQAAAILAVAWGCCSALPAGTWQRFSDWMLQLCKDHSIVTPPCAHQPGGSAAVGGKRATIFDCVYDFHGLRWALWDSDEAAAMLHVRTPLPPGGASYILTREAAPVLLLASVLAQQCSNLLLAGPPGCGKSAMAQAALVLAGSRSQVRGTSSPGELHQLAQMSRRAATGQSAVGPLRLIGHTVHYCARMDAGALRGCLGQALLCRREGVVAPPLSTRLVVVVEDMHDAGCEGSFRPVDGCALELLRQYCCTGGWDGDGRGEGFVEVADVQLLGCLTRSDAVQRWPSPRLLWHTAQLTLPDPSSASMEAIFSPLMAGVLQEGLMGAMSQTLHHDLSGLLRGVSGPMPPLQAASPARAQRGEVGQQLLGATIELLAQVRARLPPVPQRPLCSFSLHHVASVVQGMVAAPPQATRRSLLWLWQHECFRVFCDRIPEAHERGEFQRLLAQVLQHNVADSQDMVLSSTDSPLFCHLPPALDPFGLLDTCSSPLQYGSALAQMPDPQAALTFLTGQSDGDMPQPRHRRASITRLSAVLPGDPIAGFIAGQYQELVDSTGPGDPDFFAASGEEGATVAVHTSAAVQIARLLRALSQPRGHATLLGNVGVGKRTLARVAAGMLALEVHDVVLRPGLSRERWHHQVKEALLSAGVDNKGTLLLVSEAGVLDADRLRMLADISRVMAAGHLEAVFSPQDMQRILHPPQAADAPPDPSRRRPTDSSGAQERELWQQFLGRCRSNVHVVLCLMPQWDALLARAAACPGLFRGTVSYVDNWDLATCKQVASHLLMDGCLCLPDAVQQIRFPDVCAEVFFSLSSLLAPADLWSTVKPWWSSCATGSHAFCEFLKAVAIHLPLHINQAVQLQQQLSGASAQIALLNQQLVANRELIKKLRPQIAGTMQAQEQDAAALHQDTNLREQLQLELAACEAAAAESKEQLRKLRDANKMDLQRAATHLQDAERNLAAGLDHGAVHDLVNHRDPPPGVRLVMRCICTVLGRRPSKAFVAEEQQEAKVWWDEALGVLEDPALLRLIAAVDRDTVSEEVQQHLNMCAHNPLFSPRPLRRINHGAAALCGWALALDAYCRAKKVLAPKELALQQLATLLQEQQAAIQSLQLRLQQAEDRLLQVRQHAEELAQLLEQQQGQLADALQVEEQVQPAVEAFQQDAGSWAAAAKREDAHIRTLPADIILGAAQMTLLPLLDFTTSTTASSRWHSILRGADLLPSTSHPLLDIICQRTLPPYCRSLGLPPTQSAVQIAAALHHSRHRVLAVVDAEDCLGPWVRAGGWCPMENYVGNLQSLLVLQQLSPDFLTDLCRSVEAGVPVVVEAHDSYLHPAVMDLLHGTHNPNHDPSPRPPSTALPRALSCALTHAFSSSRLQTSTSGAPSTHERVSVAGVTVRLHPSFRLLLLMREENASVQWQLLQQGVHVVRHCAGLEEAAEALMTVALVHEMPDLEQEQISVMRQQVRNTGSLQEVVQALLQQVCSTRAVQQLLDPQLQARLAGLQAAILKQQQQALHHQRELDRLRQTRSELAQGLLKHAGCAYFATQALSKLHPTYRFSLRWFSGVLQQALLSAQRSSMRAERLQALSQELSYQLLTRLAYVLELAHTAAATLGVLATHLQVHQMATSEEVGLLLSGGQEGGLPFWLSTLTTSPIQRSDTLAAFATALPATNRTSQRQLSSVELQTIQTHMVPAHHLDTDALPAMPWLPPTCQEALKQLSSHPAFTQLLSSLHATPRAWQKYHSLLLHDVNAPPPAPWVAGLSVLHKLLLIRCFQPGAIEGVLQESLAWLLGSSRSAQLAPRQQDHFSALDAVVAAGNSSTPLLLMAERGEEPLRCLEAYAAGRNRRITWVLLGDGQGAAAEKLIRSSVTQAKWVVLEACHCAGAWAPQLAALLHVLPAMSPNYNFRLWLTAPAEAAVPAALLAPCTKVTLRQPSGLKQALQSVLSEFPVNPTPSNFPHKRCSCNRSDPGSALEQPPSDHGCVAAPPADEETVRWRQAMAVLAALHAVLQERSGCMRGVQPGCTFSTADFAAAAHQASRYMAKHPSAPWWMALHSAVDCVYLAKASSPMQRTELHLVLQKLLHPQQGTAGGPQPLLPGLPPLPLGGPLEGLAALAANLDVEPVVALQACFLDGPCCLERQQSVQRERMLQAMQLLPELRDGGAAFPPSDDLTLVQNVEELLSALPTSILEGSSPLWMTSHSAAHDDTKEPLLGLLRHVYLPDLLQQPSQDLAAEAAAPQSEGPSDPTPRLSLQLSDRRSRSLEPEASSSSSVAGEGLQHAARACIHHLAMRLLACEAAAVHTVFSAAARNLQELQGALQGAAPFTPDLLRDAAALRCGVIPRSWSWAASPEQPAATSVEDWCCMLGRAKEFVSLYACEGPPCELPLPVLLDAGRALGCVRLAHSMAAGTPVGGMVWAVDGAEMARQVAGQQGARVSGEVAAAASGGVVKQWREGRAWVSGLGLNGAAWHRAAAALLEASPGAASPSPLPLLCLRLIQMQPEGQISALTTAAATATAATTAAATAAATAVTAGAAAAAFGSPSPSRTHSQGANNRAGTGTPLVATASLGRHGSATAPALQATAAGARPFMCPLVQRLPRGLLTWPHDHQHTPQEAGQAAAGMAAQQQDGAGFGTSGADAGVLLEVRVPCGRRDASVWALTGTSLEVVPPCM